MARKLQPLASFALRHIAIASVALLSTVGTCFTPDADCEDFDIACQPLLLALFQDYGGRTVITNGGGTGSSPGVYTFRIDPDAGSLTLVASYVTGDNFAPTTFESTRDYVFTANNTGGLAHSVGGDGVPSAPLGTTGLVILQDHAIHSSGSLYYQASTGSGISSYFFAGGSFSATGQPLYNVNGQTNRPISAHPSGTMLSTSGTDYYVLSVDQGTGALTQTQVYTPTSGPLGTLDFEVHESGNYAIAYTRGGAAGFHTLSFGADGQIVADQQFTFSAGNTNFKDLTITGNFMYGVKDFAIERWQIDSSGGLSNQTSVVTGVTGNMQAVEADPTTGYLYTANYLNADGGRIVGYRINGDGSLTQVSAIDTGYGPNMLMVRDGFIPRY